jgi:hypothetical protein
VREGRVNSEGQESGEKRTNVEVVEHVSGTDLGALLHNGTDEVNKQRSEGRNEARRTVSRAIAIGRPSAAASGEK